MTQPVIKVVYVAAPADMPQANAVNAISRALSMEIPVHDTDVDLIAYAENGGYNGPSAIYKITIEATEA